MNKTHLLSFSISSTNAFNTTTYVPLLMHEFLNPFIHICLDESVYNKFVWKEQAKKTQYWPDLSPENRDSPACSINIVSCRDETSPGGYFAYQLAVKDLSTLGFSVTMSDKEIYLNLGVLKIDFCEGKIKRNHIHILKNKIKKKNLHNRTSHKQKNKNVGKKSELF